MCDRTVCKPRRQMGKSTSPEGGQETDRSPVLAQQLRDSQFSAIYDTWIFANLSHLRYRLGPTCSRRPTFLSSGKFVGYQADVFMHTAQ